jgi:HK97 family phage portal protein
MNFKFWTWGGGSSSTSNDKGEQYTRPKSKAFTRQKSPTLDQALQLSAFWAGITRWTRTISSLPVQMQVWDESENQWVADKENPLQQLFDYKVNRYQTRIEFMNELSFNLMSTGNAYVLVRRDKNKVVSLLPLSSTQMEVRVLDDGTKVFVYTRDGRQSVIAADNIWHTMLFGNNVVGMSPLSYGATAIGVGLSADERSTQVLDNAAKPSGILYFDSALKLTDKQRAQLKTEFKALKEGTDNVLMTLESGWKYEQIGLNPQDIQLLESRKFSIEDIGRFLDIPSILLNDMSASTGWGSGITQIIEGWYKLSLRPMTDYIAQSAGVHLIEAGKRKKTRVHFDFDALLQLSRKDRAEANQKEINSGTMTPNEARLSEGRLPKDGGDELLINTALQPIDQYLTDLARGQSNEV